MRQLLGLALLFFLTHPAWSQELSSPALTDAERLQICGTRTSCSVQNVHDAGTGPHNERLRIAILGFGFNDKPEFSPENGCDPYGNADGGEEYWLLGSNDEPRLIFALCNDGYGASGVGSDSVDIGDNELTHAQYGGSASRWDITNIYRLAPLERIRQRRCLYHTLDDRIGESLDIDFISLKIRQTAKDRYADANPESTEIGCPDMPSEQDFSATPANGVFGSFPIPLLSWNDTPPVPAGAGLGDCSLTLSTDGRNGFLVHGVSSAPATTATVHVVAENSRTLLIQIDDPLSAQELLIPRNRSSWIHLPHIEIWQGTYDPGQDRIVTHQIGIDLGGTIYPALRALKNLPTVSVWDTVGPDGTNYKILRLTWTTDDPFASGLGIVYSQAEGGAQARLVANMGLVKNTPLSLPAPVNISDSEDGDIPTATRCRMQDGQLRLQR